MSAGAWIRAQRDRPISTGERRIAFTLIALAATVGTLLLTTVPGGPSQRAATPHHASARLEAPTPAGPVASTAAEERAAREFMHGYLAYIYGRARAREVRGATSAFTHALLARPPWVPPSMRARHPRVVAVHLAGTLGVTVIINDGGLVDYPVALLLVRRGRRLLVSGLVGA